MTSKNKGPPLEFTAPDLEKAKAEAYEQGRKAGFAEGQAGLTKQVLALVQNIRQNSSLLFAAEDERKALYEAEALNLTYSIVRKIFPLLSRHSGIEDVREKLREIVAAGLKSNTLIIEVPVALAEETRAFMAQENMTPETGFQLNASSALRGTECRLSWADGGDPRPQKYCAENFSILEETLAARGITVHDEGRCFWIPCRTMPLRRLVCLFRSGETRNGESERCLGEGCAQKARRQKEE